MSCLPKLRCRKAENLIVPHRVASSPASVAGVALYRVDHAVLGALHNAHMVHRTVLSGPFAIRQNFYVYV